MIGSNVISLFRPRPVDRDWNNQELAEFYRVESSLITVGFHVDTERGLSDEGEPWFVFVDATSGDVIVHCARTDGAYLIASAAFEGVLRGVDFRALVESFLERQPLALPKIETPEQRNNIHLHPSAFLVALVATAFFKLSSTGAEAAVLADGEVGHDPYGIDADSASERLGIELDKRQSLVVLAAVAVVTGQALSDVADVSGVGVTAHYLNDSAAPVEGHRSSTPLPTFVDNAEGSRLAEAINGVGSGERGMMSSADGGSGSVLGTVLADVLFGDAPLDLIAVEAKGGGVLSEAGRAEMALVSLGQALLDFSGSPLDISSMEHAISNLGHHATSSSADEARSADKDVVALNQSPVSDISARSVVPSVQFVEATGLERAEGVSAAVLPSSAAYGKGVPSDASSNGQQAYIPPETTGGIDLQRLLHSVAGELDVKVGQVRIDAEVRKYDDEARALILSFVQQEDDRRTHSSGQELIVYDSRLSDAEGKDISFVTWAVEGGGTISILGVVDYDQIAA